MIILIKYTQNKTAKMQFLALVNAQCFVEHLAPKNYTY